MPTNTDEPPIKYLLHRSIKGVGTVEGIEMLKRIAIYFNVSIDYLVGRTFLEAPRPIDLSDEDITLLRKYHTLKPDEIACVKHVIDTFANRN